MHLHGTKSLEKLKVIHEKQYLSEEKKYEFYNAPFYEKYFIEEIDLEYFRDINMDNIINFLIEGRGNWKRCLEKISMHRNVDIPKYEKMHQWPESGSLLSPVSDIIMQKSRGSMASSEQSMKPSRSIIGDTLYTQYTKLRAKQIKELNKR
ncbi:hypothetical protein Gotri_007485 [Gossypium trilobum]|uniref:Uncharacterized protein n=1 Tax=Gossypium trilobum TaxID=34281 RepID=A0A7J9EG74_9ROSI|nr:hypothetical protein [Gossypium trilobum]